MGTLLGNPRTQTHRLEYEKPIPDKVVRSFSDGGSDDAVYGEVPKRGETHCSRTRHECWEDHPRTCKGLISMGHGDHKSPKDRVVPLPNGRTSWLVNGGYLPLTKRDDPPSGQYLPSHG